MRRNQRGFTFILALLILVVVGLMGFIGWRVVDDRSSSKATLQPPANNQPQKKRPPSSTQQSLQGRIVYSSCGNSNTACDSFSFVDSEGKYWQIDNPYPQLNDYAGSNKQVRITATKTGESSLKITSVEGLR